MCMTERQYDNRMKKIQELDEQIKELEAMKKALEAEIKEDMGDLEEVRTKKFVIRFQRIVSSRFDSKAFQKAHSKLYKEFCRPSESRRFSYKGIA